MSWAGMYVLSKAPMNSTGGGLLRQGTERRRVVRAALTQPVASSPDRRSSAPSVERRSAPPYPGRHGKETTGARGMQSVVEQPIVLFTSWQGLFYSDNPRALSEQLCDRDVPLERVWVVGEHTGPVPADVRTVRRGSAAHHAALERARYIVSNDTIHDAFVKAPGARYVQ